MNKHQVCLSVPRLLAKTVDPSIRTNEGKFRYAGPMVWKETDGSLKPLCLRSFFPTSSLNMY